MPLPQGTPAPSKIQERLALTIHGRVQGVGFRPFVWRLARDLALSGNVRNTSAGVRIEIQGEAASMEAFRARLESEAPPLAKITAINVEKLAPFALENDFQILASQGHAGQNVLVSPDVGICDDCLAEMRDPANHRFAYPFINCVNCGPRFSITRGLPYDRPLTSMACFPLCERCAREYTDPGDRRFHAQPVACADCGPQILFVSGPDMDQLSHYSIGSMAEDVAISRAVETIKAGRILALKGLGGFQLACDARNESAVATLRQRKRRPHKALAVMAADLDSICQFCSPTPAERELLAGAARPIVICARMPEAPAPLADLIAPDTEGIGVMLPSAPLHVLLLDRLREAGMANPALVMTSANPANEPICLGNREALATLNDFADAWLLHNRDILVRVDDSVTRIRPSEDGTAAPCVIRRARGYVPEPVSLPGPENAIAVLGVGAEMKATFCLTRGNRAFVSQHLGDLNNPATFTFYREALAHMQRLLETAPGIIVRDLHPNFTSTRFALELGARDGLPVIALQHHAAHAASALLENSCHEPALAICLDGTGYGEDGTIWGGELLYMDLSKPEWRRVGALSLFPLPGGEAAIREPWRIAQGLAKMSGLNNLSLASAQDIGHLNVLIERGINSPQTSSCGRLFDAASALLGFCHHSSYEAQAAIRLEKAAGQWLGAHSGKIPPLLEGFAIKTKGDIPRLDATELFASVAEHLRAGADPDALAASFHETLAYGFARLASQSARELGTRKVACSGGVLQNTIMASSLERHLRQAGLEPLFQCHLPPGDGGLSLGQAFWGRTLAIKGKLEVEKYSGTV